MLTINVIIVVFWVRPMWTMELHAVMNKLDSIELKISKLDTTVSNIELKMNENAQKIEKLDQLHLNANKLDVTVNNIELKMNENAQQLTDGIGVISKNMEEIALQLSDIVRVDRNTDTTISEHQNSMEQGNRKYGKNKFAKGERGLNEKKKRTRRQVTFGVSNQTAHTEHDNNKPTNLNNTKNDNITDTGIHGNPTVNSERGINTTTEPHIEAKHKVNEARQADSNRINATSEEFFTSIIVDLYKINESMVQYYEIILDRLGFIEETLQTVVEDREFMSKDIKRVSKEVDGFALQMSDAIQDVCDFGYLKTGIDDIREDLHVIDHTMNASIDNIHTMNETLKLHIADTIHQSVWNFTSCSDLAFWYTGSGVYNTRYMRLYCDQLTDGGGWTVFQRRRDGSESFHRNWSDYKHGFGHLNDEFWLGNEKLTILTGEGDCELFINMTSHDDYIFFAKYSKFKIHSEKEGYRLEVSGFSGDAEDGLKYHNGMKFSTYDSDNDYNFFKGSCAQSWESGWWYRNCYESDLNGKYRTTVEENGGIMWQQFALQFVEMKLRCS